MQEASIEANWQVERFKVCCESMLLTHDLC